MQINVPHVQKNIEKIENKIKELGLPDHKILLL